MRRYDRVARRWCGWTLLLAIVSTFLPAHGQTPRGGDTAGAFSDGGAVIPDTGGRISELLLLYDPLLGSELAPLYDDLFKVLGDRLLIRVICPDSASAVRFADRWGEKAQAGGREVEVVAVGMPLTIWARDRCIARQSRTLLRRASYFVPADEFDYPEEKQNDRMVQALLSLAGLLPGIYSSPLQLEGGNVVANRRHVFVGANVIMENASLHRKGALPRELRRLFGRPYVLVGDRGGAVPWCHVDMYVTPIDDRTVLVASPMIAERLLELAADQGDELAADLLRRIEPAKDEQPLFDAVAERIAGKGYRVLRVPAVVDRAADWMMTYNNVVLERRDGRRFAYVPQYGVPILDEEGMAIYASLGFDAQPVSVSGIYGLGGALRCVVNVTHRDPQERRTAVRRTRPAGVTIINLAPNMVLDAYDCTDDAAVESDGIWDRGDLPQLPSPIGGPAAGRSIR
jgi:hypothetical protein